MKIVQLDIQGFRSLKNVSWRPGDLNVIIGPNGSGKSNLLKMLELISAAAQGKLSDYVQRSGGMDALVWDGRVNSIGFRIQTSAGYSYNKLQGLTFEAILPSLNYELEIVRLGFGRSYRVQQELFRNEETSSVYVSRTGLTVQVIEGDKTLNVKPGRISEEEAILPFLNTPLDDGLTIPSLEEIVNTWTVYQNIRTDQNAPIRQALVTRLEQSVAPDGQNLINVLHTLYTGDRDFKRDINDAMSAAFGADYDELIFPPAADQRIQMRVRWKTLKREQSTADLSDGTLRFLFLMTVLASPNPPPLIAIDEPETGLHPSMLPIIAEFAVEASRRTQVVFTTHSDQFLDAFRDAELTTTVAKWENGETTLKTLDKNDLAYWRKEYSLGSLFRSGELESMGV